MSDGNLSLEEIEIAQAPAGAAAPAAIGRVDSVIGRVTITRVDGSQATAESGQPIFKGDQVTTAVDGKLGIVFADHSSFSIGERGSMTIDEMVYDPGTQAGKSVLNIASGVFSFVSGELAKAGPESMVLHTPVATIGVRGTTGAGKAAPAGQTNTFALLPDASGSVGEVSVTTQSGTSTMNVAYQALQVTSPFLPPPTPVVVPPSVMAKAFGGVTASLPQASQPAIGSPTGPGGPGGPVGPAVAPAAGPAAGSPAAGPGGPVGPGGPGGAGGPGNPGALAGPGAGPGLGPVGPVQTQTQAVAVQVEAAVNRAFDQAMGQGGGSFDGAFAAAVQVSAVAASIVASFTPAGAGATPGIAGAPAMANIQAALNSAVGHAIAAGLAFGGASGGRGADGSAPVQLGPIGPGGFGFGVPGPGGQGPAGTGTFGPGPGGFGPGGPGQGFGGPGGRGPEFGGPGFGGPENGGYGIGVPGFGFGPFGPGPYGPGPYYAGQYDVGFVPPESRSVRDYVSDFRDTTPERTTNVFQEVLTATIGNDSLVGGDGNTQFSMAEGRSLGGIDTVNGGGGQDELNLTNLYNFKGVWDLNLSKIVYEFTPSGGSLVSGSLTVISVEQLYADDGTETPKRTPIDPTSGYGYLRAGTENADTLTLVHGTVIAGYTVGADTRGTITFGGLGDDTITGSVKSDDIFGGGDNDTITGGEGGDQLYGGGGNDTFVFAASDFASGESADGGTGTDTLSLSGSNAFSSGTLAGIEALTFTGTATATFSGTQVNTSTALASALAVTGSGGTDAIVVNMASGTSTQTVTLASWTFGSWTSGTDTIAINGGAGAETITGSSQQDTITGGEGADTITGGAGADAIILTETTSAADIVKYTTSDGVDAISSWLSGTDKLQFTRSIFNGDADTNGILDAGTLVSAAGATAADANDYWLFDTTTKTLKYDADGSGGGAAVSIATFDDDANTGTTSAATVIAADITFVA